MTPAPPSPLAPAPGPLRWRSSGPEHGERIALLTAEETVTYADLAARVDAFADRLAGDRRLVLIEARNTLDTVVAYLAALDGGHVVALVDGRAEALSATVRRDYDPDVIIRADGRLDVIRERSRHRLHPDLALLLSTSGSTGSGKLVRLSRTNLAANADQIAQILAIRETDRAVTTLPLSYCYGLSLLHSHLRCGAAVLLTELSVVDDCFWTLFRRAGATTLAGVPHTFELLERVGFKDMELPRLRYVTQAGGRMDPERVRHWAASGQRRGWDLFVMYGQTEATARMAYLPPHLALEHPGSIGIPVPGGGLAVEDGELVYCGPNVMLGYATSPADLGMGRTVTSLCTGDLGRCTPEGLFEVVGRRSRFIKVLGHRVDLDVVEARLRGGGLDARCGGEDERLVVTVRGGPASPSGHDEAVVRDQVAAVAAVPRHAVHVAHVADHPVLPTGKTDYRAIATLAAEPAGEPAARGSVAELYAVLLGRREVAPDATFVSLGGDSLSYVEVSIRLEDQLGHLPSAWHLRTVAQLEAERRTDGRPQAVAGAPSWRARHTVETGIWLRALAIVLIVGTHADLFSLQGSANALFVLTGYQLVRFQLVDTTTRGRTTRALRAMARVTAPALLVIATAHVVGGYYEERNLLLLNWAFGEPRLGPPWRFWFIEALVLALAITAALCVVPAFNRLEQRFPFGVPLGLTAAVMPLRLDPFELPTSSMQISAPVVLFLFFLGWSIARATTRRHRVVVTLVATASIATFTGGPSRDLLTLALVLLVVWRPLSRVPRLLLGPIRVLAASSLFIYVIHWQVLELLRGAPLLAVAASLLAGVAYWRWWTAVGRWLGPALRRLASGVRARRHTVTT